MTTAFSNAVGVQGFLDVDAEGRITVEVDDGHYSGVLSRQASLTIARAVLGCSTVAPTHLTAAEAAEIQKDGPLPRFETVESIERGEG